MPIVLQHKLRIVATDGNDIESEETESVIIQSGERFDVIVKTDAEPGNYWIRLETLETMDRNGVCCHTSYKTFLLIFSFLYF